jgi:hypothetical protein
MIFPCSLCVCVCPLFVLFLCGLCYIKGKLVINSSQNFLLKWAQVYCVFVEFLLSNTLL